MNLPTDMNRHDDEVSSVSPAADSGSGSRSPSLYSRFQEMGPGIVVTAAIVGPGTVTACTLAGANFGYALLWALLFATAATIVLQEMAARLGTVTQKGLGEALRDKLEDSVWKWPLILLVVIALFVGNTAYEAGNLSGAAMGIDAVTKSSPIMFRSFVVVISVLAGIILWRGNYRQIEKVLLCLVALMGVAFITTFFVVGPDISALLKGLFVPSIPSGSLVTVIALIGTTVVPYNLFLHSSAAKKRWKGKGALRAARTDTIISIGLGGIIAILLVSTAAASLFAAGLKVTSGADMAIQFEPLFGAYSGYFLGMGFFAAGLSSSITAPLATAYALSEILGLDSDVKSTAFRVICLTVLTVGCIFASLGINPIKLIISAQFSNGLLLPIIVMFLLVTMNSKKLLGEYTNGKIANVLGVLVLLVSITLGLKLILRSISAI